jgi:ferritin-like metal-binding protein YciE
MPIDNPSDLFLWELSGAYDAERKTNQMLGDAINDVQDGNIAQLLRIELQETEQKMRNLDACFQDLGASPGDVACLTVDGMRAEYQAFRDQQPVDDAMEMYALGSAMRLAQYGASTYKGLVDMAMLLGEIPSAQILQTNLVQKQDSAGRLERFSHEMSQPILANAYS